MAFKVKPSSSSQNAHFLKSLESQVSFFAVCILWQVKYSSPSWSARTEGLPAVSQLRRSATTPSAAVKMTDSFWAHLCALLQTAGEGVLHHSIKGHSASTLGTVPGIQWVGGRCCRHPARHRPGFTTKPGPVVTWSVVPTQKNAEIPGVKKTKTERHPKLWPLSLWWRGCEMLNGAHVRQTWSSEFGP